MAENDAIPFWWIVVFVVLALGLGALAVSAYGGSLIQGGVVLPPVAWT